MKRNYIIPITEKVNFGADEATMNFTNTTDATNAGGPTSGKGAPVRLDKLYI